MSDVTGTIEELAEQLKAAAETEPEVEVEPRKTKRRKSEPETEPAKEIPDPNAAIQKQLQAAFGMTGGVIGTLFDVPPFTEAESKMLADAWGPVLEYYASELDPVIMMWASAIITTGGVAYPRVLAYRANQAKDVTDLAQVREKNE